MKVKTANKVKNLSPYRDLINYDSQEGEEPCQDGEGVARLYPGGVGLGEARGGR